MKLDDLKMDQLRKLGYELEEIVLHEVRGNSAEALRNEILNAVLELDTDGLQTFGESAKANHGIDLEIPLVKSEELTQEELAELTEDTLLQMGFNKDFSVDDWSQVSGPDGKTEDETGGEDIYVQIRSMPIENGLHNNELLKNPKQDLLDKYSHAILSHEQFIDLKAAGYRLNEDPRFSEAKQAEEEE